VKFKGETSKIKGGGRLYLCEEAMECQMKGLCHIFSTTFSPPFPIKKFSRTCIFKSLDFLFEGTTTF